MANIDLSNITWCPRHWQPYQMRLAYAVAATLFMFQEVVNRIDFARECGWDPETGAAARAERINAVLRAHQPTCCYLGDQAMERILQKCLMPSRNKAVL